MSFSCTCHILTIEKREAMYLQEIEKEHMEGFRWKKEKEEML